MPSKTPKQQRTMAAACKNPQLALKLGIPKAVGCEFMKEDQMKAKKKPRPNPK